MDRNDQEVIYIDRPHSSVQLGGELSILLKNDLDKGLGLNGKQELTNITFEYRWKDMNNCLPVEFGASVEVWAIVNPNVVELEFTFDETAYSVQLRWTVRNLTIKLSELKELGDTQKPNRRLTELIKNGDIEVDVKTEAGQRFEPDHAH